MHYDLRAESCRYFIRARTVEVEVTISAECHRCLGIVNYRTADSSAGISVEIDPISGYGAVDSIEITAERCRKTRCQKECSCFVTQSVKLNFLR